MAIKYKKIEMRQCITIVKLRERYFGQVSFEGNFLVKKKCCDYFVVMHSRVKAQHVQMTTPPPMNDNSLVQ